MILTEEKRKEFYEVMKPIMEYMDKNFHPHCTIIVTSNNAELLEGVAATINKNLLD
jgi:hypothetical protein